MTRQTPDRFSRTIVILGDFNPKIYQPSWLAAENLIGKQESEEAKIEVIHSDVSIFSLGWLRLEVLRERFVAEISQQPFDKPLRDLVLGIFTLLRHTPIRVMGINTSVHFRLSSIEKWHEAGNRLAPKTLWADVLDNPGMIRVQMRETERKDKKNGYVDVRIEPSAKIQPGLFFHVNDHYEGSGKELMNTEEMLAILGSNWDESTLRAEQIIYGLLEKVTA